MRNIQVESQGIKQIAYNLPNQILHVDFYHGGAYKYFGITPEMYAMLMNSHSHGVFFNRHIRPYFTNKRS